jgi:hypothetical protein
LNAQPTISPRYSDADVETLRTLISQLLAECASVAAQHAPTGAWSPTASHPQVFQEASEVIESISRSLNQTRRHIRALHERARRPALPVTQAPHDVRLADHGQGQVTACGPFRTPDHVVHEQLPPLNPCETASPLPPVHRPQTKAV